MSAPASTSTSSPRPPLVGATPRAPSLPLLLRFLARSDASGGQSARVVGVIQDVMQENAALARAVEEGEADHARLGLQASTVAAWARDSALQQEEDEEEEEEKREVIDARRREFELQQAQREEQWRQRWRAALKASSGHFAPLQSELDAAVAHNAELHARLHALLHNNARLVEALRSTRERTADAFVYSDAWPGQRFVRHLVQPDDDLVDLALRYDTTPGLIRQHNRRLVFDRTDNVTGEAILIPVPAAFVLLPTQPGSGAANVDSASVEEPSRAVRSFQRQLVKRAAFREEDACSDEEAAFYLFEAQYDVDAAVAAYVGDREWEQQQRKSGERPLSGRAERAADELGKAGPHSSRLALAEAKQARLSALSNDASAPRLQQQKQKEPQQHVVVDRPLRVGTGAQSLSQPLLTTLHASGAVDASA